MQDNPQLVLATDVTLTPIETLSPSNQKLLQVQAGDAVVSRRRGRMNDATVSADAARLLRAFEEPRTVVDAVIEVVGEDLDKAQQALQESLPLVQSWIDKGILVDPEVAIAGPVLEPGEEHDGWTVLRAVQLLEDTEVYQVRTPEGGLAALKVQRTASVGSLDQEAEVLTLGLSSALPGLQGRGTHDSNAYLLIDWCRGVGSGQAAAELRAAGDRLGLLELCRRIADAYAELHEAGFLHGDVHPRNILVDRDCSVRLIDFGLACPMDAPQSGHLGRVRPGVPFYYEPEHARSMVAGEGPKPLSASGEQFAVCVLLYQLVCGAHYTDFDLYRDTLFQRIAEASPKAFQDRACAPWPELEAILSCGLASQPEDRYPSMAALAAALRALSDEDLSVVRNRSTDDDAVHHLLRHAALDGPWWTGGFETFPTATVKFGAAGIAFALHRIAGVRGDGEILALADVWAQRAAREISTQAGLYNNDLDIDLAKTGTTTPFHTASGVAAVQGFLAKARGDVAGLRRAVRAFIEASNPEERERDLTLGRCGSLLLCALLRDVMTDWGLAAESAPSMAEPLDVLGRQLDDDLWRELNLLPDLDAKGEENLAIAHGWAGYLYASLQWVRASRGQVSSSLVDRLEQLAELGFLQDRGRCWSWRLGNGWTSGAGWCNGSAGFVFLWSLAARLTGEIRYRDLAVDAVWTAWEVGGRNSSLCCGLTGQAYALLNVAKHSGDAVWIERARHLASRARPDDTPFPHSLYKGETGLAVLQADLERPAEAAMPFFEEDAGDVGWP